VIELSKDQQEIGDIVVGRPLGSYRVYNYAGVNPADGRSMWYDRDGNITYQPRATYPAAGTPGDPDFRDADPMGDRIWAGRIYPDYFGGLGNTLSYGGLSLNVFLQFNVGQETFNQFQGYFLNDPSFVLNMERRMLDRWQEPGDMTDIPKLWLTRNFPGMASNITASNRFIEDVSYVRLKNVMLSYQVPAQFVRGAGLQGASIFVQGQNLHTWTAYTGIDPEMIGNQAAIYPQSRSITTGIQVQF
jgi:TonB-dependent starch-binding outer membrane protein SusC